MADWLVVGTVLGSTVGAANMTASVSSVVDAAEGVAIGGGGGEGGSVAVPGGGAVGEAIVLGLPGSSSSLSSSELSTASSSTVSSSSSRRILRRRAVLFSVSTLGISRPPPSFLRFVRRLLGVSSLCSMTTEAETCQIWSDEKWLGLKDISRKEKRGGGRSAVL